jgi:hypothetical protein
MAGTLAVWQLLSRPARRTGATYHVTHGNMKTGPHQACEGRRWRHRLRDRELLNAASRARALTGACRTPRAYTQPEPLSQGNRDRTGSDGGLGPDLRSSCTETAGRRSHIDPIWRRIKELHTQRFKRKDPIDPVDGLC